MVINIKNMEKDIKLTLEQEYEINESGLFHWNSSLRNDEKLKIMNWHKSLSQKEKDYIDILREQSFSDGYEVGANDESL